MNIVQGGGFIFQKTSIGGIWRWAIRANNIQGGGQLYELTDINTPYGPLIQTAIPIPGDIITSMAESLSEIQQQLSPLVALIDPSINAYNITIVEGDSNKSVANIGIFNAGAFGSFLTVISTPSVPWLRSSPVSIPGLGKNQSDYFNVTLLTASLFESDSPYLGTVHLQDNRIPATQISLDFIINVLPRPIIAISPPLVNLVYFLSTSSGSSPATVSIQNAGPANSILNWLASKVHNTSPWLTVSPVNGGPLVSSESGDAVFSINPSGIPSTPGLYKDSVRVSSPTASNGFVDIQVELNVLV
jgi:hypothetical protein